MEAHTRNLHNTYSRIVAGRHAATSTHSWNLLGTLLWCSKNSAGIYEVILLALICKKECLEPTNVSMLFSIKTGRPVSLPWLTRKFKTMLNDSGKRCANEISPTEMLLVKRLHGALRVVFRWHACTIARVCKHWPIEGILLTNQCKQNYSIDCD